MTHHTRSLPLFLFALLCCSLQCAAETSVWKISKGNNTVYLGGTIHMLKPGDYPLPSAFDIAYIGSQKVFFETDVGAMNQPEAQTQILAQSMAPPERQLDRVLTPQTYSLLTAAASERGMDIALLSRLRAGIAIITLQTLEFMKLGFTTEGVDHYFYSKALQDRKPVGYLESVQEQVNFLLHMGEDWEDEFVALSLRDLYRTAELMDGMNLAWREGDTQEMATQFLAEMEKDYPRAYRDLLVNRNLAWLPRIEQMFEQPGVEFVLVGAAHMVGEDGLLSLLEKRGYSIVQMK